MAVGTEAKEKDLKSLRRAVFLDRDGTLNEDPGYLRDPAALRLLPGVSDALGRLSAAGYSLVVVSNQSGVNRGLIPAEAIPAINARFNELITPAKIDLFNFCFHRPEEGCECRKPKPKLLRDAANALDLDLASSWMIGDRLGDIMAGKNAGCRGSVLVLTGEGSFSQAELARLPEAEARSNRPDFIAESLGHAADWILNPGTSSP